MNPSLLHVVHVFGLAALVGYSFYAFAGPPAETKKRVMMFTGIASLLMLIAGGAMVTAMGYSWKAGWIWVKLVCWLVLSGLPGMAYRRPEKTGLFITIALVLVLIALYMVYYKPF